jgi:hypothetical protein
MNNFFRALIAGYGAKKLGGGCFGTILVFVLIWVALGQCSFSSRKVPAPESYPAGHRVCVPVQPELICCISPDAVHPAQLLTPAA